MIAFSESNSRLIVEVSPRHQKEFEYMLADLPIACIGKVIQGSKFEVRGVNGDVVIFSDIAELKESWQKTLRW